MSVMGNLTFKSKALQQKSRNIWGIWGAFYWLWEDDLDEDSQTDRVLGRILGEFIECKPTFLAWQRHESLQLVGNEKDEPKQKKVLQWERINAGATE